MLSSLAAVYASDLTDELANKLAVASVELVAENLAFYLAMWLFGLLLPQKDRLIKEGKETWVIQNSG